MISLTSHWHRMMFLFRQKGVHHYQIFIQWEPFLSFLVKILQNWNNAQNGQIVLSDLCKTVWKKIITKDHVLTPYSNTNSSGKIKSLLLIGLYGRHVRASRFPSLYYRKYNTLNRPEIDFSVEAIRTKCLDVLNNKLNVSLQNTDQGQTGGQTDEKNVGALTLVVSSIRKEIIIVSKSYLYMNPSCHVDDVKNDRYPRTGPFSSAEGPVKQNRNCPVIKDYITTWRHFTEI